MYRFLLGVKIFLFVCSLWISSHGAIIKQFWLYNPNKENKGSNKYHFESCLLLKRSQETSLKVWSKSYQILLALRSRQVLVVVCKVIFVSNPTDVRCG